MTVDNPISMLVARYRRLKAQADADKREMSDLKAEIEPLVTAAGGKWKDEDGYARFATYKPSVSFETRAVNALVEAWCESDDPVMKSCGVMLKAYRKQRDGYTSFQIR